VQSAETLLLSATSAINDNIITLMLRVLADGMFDAITHPVQWMIPDGITLAPSICGKSFLRRLEQMDLAVWIPLTFGLGIVTMLVCYAFLKACEKI
jgi:hypothetical protein